MYQTLEYKCENHVATVMLNRPERKNALNTQLFHDLADVGEAIKSNADVRAVVLYGAANCFCAGLDTETFTDDSIGLGLIPRTHGITNVFQQSAWVWHEVPVPVIAAIDGVCLGGGLQIACGADMRYVHPDTKMSILEIKWGLVPDMAGTMLWSRYVKEDLLRDLSYSGEMFDGAKGLEYGFCTRLSDNPLELALKTAQNIANRSPNAIRANKRLLNSQGRVSEREGMMAESIEQDELLGSQEQMEVVMANIEKRLPVFKPK